MNKCFNLKKNFEEVKDSDEDCYKNEKDIVEKEKCFTRVLNEFGYQMIIHNLINKSNWENVLEYFPKYLSNTFIQMIFIHVDFLNSMYIAYCILHIAVQNIPGAKKWIIDDGKIYSKHPIMSLISNYQSVSDEGHQIIQYFGL